CGVPLNTAIRACCQAISDEAWQPCIDKESGEVAEFSYRMDKAKRPRRFICKRIPRATGEQLTLEDGAYHYWVCVTNDHQASPVALESEHRHKANVEAGMRELKSNFGLHALRKHGFMANWAWLLLVCLGHNLCCWTQTLGRLEAGRDGSDLRAKRLRYRYLVVPALLVRSARQMMLKLRADYPFLRRFLVALKRLRMLPAPAS
ncbi:MAG: transposase, partial [bacterium]